MPSEFRTETYKVMEPSAHSVGACRVARVASTEAMITNTSTVVDPVVISRVYDGGGGTDLDVERQRQEQRPQVSYRRAIGFVALADDEYDDYTMIDPLAKACCFGLGSPPRG